MRASGTFSQKGAQSPTRGLNFSMSSMGSPSRNGFSTTKSSNMTSFSTALHQIKCGLQGHQQKSIQWVCMAKECQFETRLVCSKCYAGQHSIHQKFMVKVQEIFDNLDDQNIQNWPLEDRGKQVKEYVNVENQYIQGLYQELDVFFDGLQEQLLKRLEALKKSLLLDINVFYLRGEGKEKVKFLDNLKKMYSDAYDFSDLQDLIKKFFQREITYDTFQTQINFMLNDKEKINLQQKLYNYFAKNMQNTQITDSSMVQARIDRENLKNIQKQILDGLNRFKSCVSVSQVQTMTHEDLPFTPTIGVKLGNFSSTVENGKVQQQNWGLQIQEILNYMNQQTQQLGDRDTLIYKREIYADNSRYEGFFLNGQRHMIGTRYYADGNIYFGQWERGARQGNGVMHFSKGTYYQGEWYNDKKHGTGIEVYPNNTKFEGLFEDGLKHGQGKFTYQDGKVFEGVYVQDKRNGIGKLIYKNNQVEIVYYALGEKVTEEKYEEYLKSGGYITMSQMKGQQLQDSQYNDQSQSNNTYAFNNNIQNS
ncbi:MORN motif protein (macronuclear) [Tetrahymena thermophila SB210]|uniref:MORN motif protein n=1 Tax=Tetrahymena thermophila (strain SB210) TaxID=312017 RepID=I7M4B5_TETTS|nr:MORN motif protein [Tetrahymena thermophila SB210]EAS06160.1 MORN motif protein [Tetrahymena thermophila SB210]|eukprot:XP_001026405.1 MORN motif protein [Tetrahymena thermophila SB210]